MVTYFMVPSQLPFYAESLNIQSSTAVGFLLALVGLVWGLTSTQYARLRKMLSFEKIAMFALLSISVGYILLFLSTNITIMVIALALVGAGVGTTLPNLNTWLITTTSSEFKGRALGSFFMGQFLSPVITRPITASLGIPYGYLMGGLSLFILFVLCAVYERKKLRYDKTKQTKIKGSAV
ncbi:MFS transporter [Virgibacillus proomii]|nr:MFS transporter [Virgibacillus proomii]